MLEVAISGKMRAFFFFILERGSGLIKRDDFRCIRSYGVEGEKKKKKSFISRTDESLTHLALKEKRERGPFLHSVRGLLLRDVLARCMYIVWRS